MPKTLTLVQLREKRKLSQVELARMIGKHPSNLSDWERGVYKPNGVNVMLLAEALGVSEKEILAATWAAA